MGGAIGKVFKKIIKAVTNIFSGFMGAFGMSFDTPDMGGGASYEAQAQGMTVNKQSNVAGIPVVYGERRLGGVRVFVATTGSDNKYLYICLAVCEGEIDSFTKLYINDEAQSISSFSTSTVDVSSDSKYFVNGTSRAQFQFFTGSETQSASSLLKEHPDWNDSHRLQGVAYVACRFEWVKAEYDNDGNQTLYNPWQGVPTINVEVRGRKVLSGDYSSHGTTTANTYGADTGSFTFSNNPADCLLDYLRNPRYGKGLSDNRIDWTQFRASQVICDTNVDFPIQQANGTVDNINQDFLDCNIYLKPEDNLFQNTKKLLQTCRGFLPYTNGQYQLRIEAAELNPANLLEITDDMIIGGVTIQSPDKNSKYNEANITFNNSAKEFEADTAVYKDTEAFTEDGGESLVLTMGAPGITTRERANQFAKYMVDRSRKQLQLILTTTSETQQLVAGDLCTLSHSYYTQTDDFPTGPEAWMFKAPNSHLYTVPEYIWRVTSQKLNYDGTVDLVLLEHQNDIYDVTVQQEDRDLSAHSKAIERIMKPIRPMPPWVPVFPDPVQPSKKIFTVSAEVQNGQPNIFINNNDYQSYDGNVTEVIYNLTMGSNQETHTVTLPNRFGSGYSRINGTQIPFGATIRIGISSKYRNGQVNAVENHNITVPTSASAAATGSI